VSGASAPATAAT